MLSMFQGSLVFMNSSAFLVSKRFKLSILSVALISFAALPGCVGAPSKSANNMSQQTLPSWVMDRPSSAEVLYGIGEGLTLNEATQVGLADIANGVTTSVKSEQNTLRQRVNQKSSSSTTIQLNLTTPKFTIDNYKVEKTANFNGRFYSLISAPKEQIITKQQELLRNNNQVIQGALGNLNSEGILSQIRLLNKNQPALNQGLESLMVLMSLDPMGKLAYQHQIDNTYLYYLTLLENLKSKLVLEIGNSKETRLLADHLQSKLSESGYKFAKSNEKLYVVANEAYKNMFNSHDVRLDIQIILKSGNQELFTKKFTVNGSSVQSREAATRQANLKAQQLVDSDLSSYVGF